jgi:hypothetical protein
MSLTDQLVDVRVKGGVKGQIAPQGTRDLGDHVVELSWMFSISMNMRYAVVG